MKFTVRLENDTVGTIESTEELKIGKIISVALHDENGNEISAKGKLAEILEKSEN